MDEIEQFARANCQRALQRALGLRWRTLAGALAVASQLLACGFAVAHHFG